MTTQKLQQFKHIYLAEQVRELDRIAINEHGIPSYALMTKAGRFAFDRALKQWPDTQGFIVLCGMGNNAGDGYVFAQFAQAKGIPVTCITFGDCDALKGDAKRAHDEANKLKIHITPYTYDTLEAHVNIDVIDDDLKSIVIVDALFGTGLTREVNGIYKDAIAHANALGAKGCRILALDIPSGLSTNTGIPLGCAITADLTTTFIGHKLGLVTGQGKQHSGLVELSELEIPSSLFSRFHNTQTEHRIYSLDIASQLNALPKRLAHAHKGDNGRSVLVGGNYGFAGAIMIAAQACARLGAGLNAVLTRPEHCPSIVLMQPEIMAHTGLDSESTSTILSSADVIGIGPGLAQDEWARSWLERIKQTDASIVFDADALNLIADNTHLATKSDHHVFTPHPGEAARLLACTTADLEANRLDAVRKLQQKLGGHIVLKGAGTLVAHPNGEVMVCEYGNPGMASGGMGDALTGMLCALIAQFNQTLPLNQIVDLAVNLHAYAADREALNEGERGLLASDLCHQARQLLNGLN